MEINKETKVSIKLTKDEVKQAVFEFLSRYGKISLSEEVDKDSITLNDIRKRVAEPGMDVHDCDYYEYFDGIELIYKTK
jgi:hypothetical protein